MKKLILASTLAITMLLGTVTATAGTIPRVNVNGNKVLMQNSPFNENGNIYIPLRAVADNLGATVTWSAEDETATIKSGTATITQRIGSNKVHINSKEVELSAPALLKNGVTYVPVRFITESLGGTVSFDNKNNIIDLKIELPKDGGQKYDTLGRSIRTDNLPSNADMYSYILKGVPNEFYEMYFRWNNPNGTWKITPVEGKDYTKPSTTKNQEWGTDSNIKQWSEMVEKNLNLRLNTDYITVNQDWKNSLLNIYYSASGLDYYVDGYTKELNEYIQYMKDNHLIIEGDYYVEPSSTYLMNGGFYVRAWVKFKINSDITDKARLYNNKNKVEFTTNTWHTGYVDIELATNNMGSDGSDLMITDDGYIKE